MVFSSCEWAPRHCPYPEYARCLEIRHLHYHPCYLTDFDRQRARDSAREKDAAKEKERRREREKEKEGGIGRERVRGEREGERVGGGEMVCVYKKARTTFFAEQTDVINSASSKMLHSCTCCGHHYHVSILSLSAGVRV